MDIPGAWLKEGGLSPGLCWDGTLIPSGLLPGYHVPSQVEPLCWNLSMAVGLE